MGTSIGPGAEGGGVLRTADMFAKKSRACCPPAGAIVQGRPAAIQKKLKDRGTRRHSGFTAACSANPIAERPRVPKIPPDRQGGPIIIGIASCRPGFTTVT